MMMKQWFVENIYEIITTLFGGGSLYAFFTERKKRKQEVKSDELANLQAVREIEKGLIEDAKQNVEELREIIRQQREIIAEKDKIIDEQKQLISLQRKQLDKLKMSCKIAE